MHRVTHMNNRKLLYLFNVMLKSRNKPLRLSVMKYGLIRSIPIRSIPQLSQNFKQKGHLRTVNLNPRKFFAT